MWNILILQSILILGAFSSLTTIEKTSFNVWACCNANCCHIHQVALQITLYPGVQRVASYDHHDVNMSID